MHSTQIVQWLPWRQQLLKGQGESISGILHLSEEVNHALHSGRPVVALETTIFERSRLIYFRYPASIRVG